MIVYIKYSSEMVIAAGSRKAKGLHDAGAGFLIKGKAEFVTDGPDYDILKSKFSWLRATLAVTIDPVDQTW